jgi:hypothetical protein
MITRLLALLAFAWLAPVPALAAMDCRGTMPLLPDVRATPPAADVPAASTPFAGAWSGAWRDAKDNEAQCTTLVVEELYANGYARVVYAIGRSATLGSGNPNVWRATGRIADGVLRFRLPVFDRPLLTWRLDGDRLQGTINDAGRVTLTRTADLAALDCARYQQTAPVSRPAGARDRLTAAELLGPPSAPAAASGVHNDYFMPVGAAAPAKHALTGTITVPAMSVAFTRLGCAARPRALRGFTIAFFTHGEHLVPVVRDIIPGSSVIVSPGRVWSEPGDGGLSRASFAFARVNEINNGTHNGLATFVFDDTRVSALAVQLVQETVPWAKLDAVGRVPVTYTPGAIPNEAAVRADFATELARQMPIRPWPALPASPALAGFDGDTRPEDISANGLVMDGVVYLRGCHTRYGPFPYCREMRHGVFSVTKSMAGAVALLPLAQKYGDAVFDEKIADYLPAGTTAPGWQGVTFADALSMATGVGDEKPVREPNDPMADENKPKMFGWVFKRTAKEKLAGALSYGKYPWNRGEVLRYNSTQTFVLAVAMDAYLKSREGPNAHLWDMVRHEVFRPIGILHAPTMHTLEPDGSRGVPLLGYGLYPTVDDVAKLATLLQDGGRHDGVQLLSGAKLADALYRGTPNVGLPFTWRNRYGQSRYHLSFWSTPYRTATGCEFQIPYMSGFGGNIVSLLPNGISAFRFADAYNFDVDPMIVAGESLKPFCTKPANAAAPTPAALTVAELGADFVGHTYLVGSQRIEFASGGRLLGTVPDDQDMGTWEITPDARLCRTWTAWDGGRRRCYVVSKTEDGWQLDIPERFTRFPLRRTYTPAP